MQAFSALDIVVCCGDNTDRICPLLVLPVPGQSVKALYYPGYLTSRLNPEGP